MYEERAAGGYSRDDGTIEFYVRVRAVMPRPADRRPVVVDFGAGRGSFSEDRVSFRREVRDLRDVAHVIGLDVDPAVLENRAVDEAHVIGPDGSHPLPDRSADLVVSDYTFEHLSEPNHVAAVLDRLVRPGGWICIRTPNRHGVIALGARLVPNRLHDRALRILQPSKQARDTFPTAYQANTLSRLEALFPAPRFQVHGYAADPEPAYTGSSRALGAFFRVLARFTPEGMRSILFVFVRKREDGEEEAP